MTQGCPELGAVESKTLEMPAAIPASLHARVMSVLQTGCVKDSEASPEVARADFGRGHRHAGPLWISMGDRTENNI